MSSYDILDLRALEMDRLIAERVRKDPTLLEKARQNIQRWLKTCSSAVVPALREWEALLAQPLHDVLKVMTGTDENSKRLRQSSPFYGILTLSERTAIILKYATR